MRLLLLLFCEHLMKEDLYFIVRLPYGSSVRFRLEFQVCLDALVSPGQDNFDPRAAVVAECGERDARSEGDTVDGDDSYPGWRSPSSHRSLRTPVDVVLHCRARGCPHHCLGRPCNVTSPCRVACASEAVSSREACAVFCRGQGAPRERGEWEEGMGSERYGAAVGVGIRWCDGGSK